MPPAVWCLSGGFSSQAGGLSCHGSGAKPTRGWYVITLVTWGPLCGIWVLTNYLWLAKVQVEDLSIWKQKIQRVPRPELFCDASLWKIPQHRTLAEVQEMLRANSLQAGVQVCKKFRAQMEAPFPRDLIMNMQISQSPSR